MTSIIRAQKLRSLNTTSAISATKQKQANNPALPLQKQMRLAVLGRMACTLQHTGAHFLPALMLPLPSIFIPITTATVLHLVTHPSQQKPKISLWHTLMQQYSPAMMQLSPPCFPTRVRTRQKKQSLRWTAAQRITKVRLSMPSHRMMTRFALLMYRMTSATIK